jgi:very-short-patch-repair endonuclease
MRACGLSKDAIATLACNGHIHQKHQGVWVWGHRELSVEGRWLAATKACGPNSALSGNGCLAHWGVADWKGGQPEVTIPITERRAHPGIEIRRASRLERVMHKGIPVLPLARALDHAAASMSFVELRRATREAYRLGLITTAEVARARSRKLRAIAADLVPTRSVLEDYVLDLIREAGFEEPLVNVGLDPYVPDFRWPDRNLIVEADGRDHDNDLAQYDDAVRTRELGHEVLRITWKQAVLEPKRTVRRLAAARVAYVSA